MNPLNNIRVVLVHTTHPGNIGAVARAMKNMGLSDLVLVAPKDYPSDEAVWRASNAKDVLDNARVVDTVEEAIEDCQLVFGTSARERTIPWPLVNPRKAAESYVPEAQTRQVAIMFGREDRGLTNEELQLCHSHIHIPTNPDYSSLNIGAAVQVLCYEARMAWLAMNEGELEWNEWDVEPATVDQVERFYDHLEQTMVDIGFHKRENPKQTMPRLRRLFNRVRMDDKEVQIMRGILTGAQLMVKRFQKTEAELDAVYNKDGEHK